MTAPDAQRPVPGPPRPVPGPPRPAAAPAAPAPAGPAGTVPVPPAERFAALAERPVADHVAVFEAEHDRLQRELSTIDQL
ncbi:hypothetical protein [Modestobacter altitudinis]|uniref:hypothetical protein n=1 Tax=Modestobacter altitudinis TaxID=2213158 RepID=UPI00110CF8FB|nr:hypothetical protein [Modestobacter altitudinis]